jgi:hypothetical protein
VTIAGAGWELLVERLSIHRHGDRARTYGRYRAFVDGTPVDGLHGHVCECLGPGDNQHEGNGKRIEAGRYPLWTQFGNTYRSVGYAGSPATPDAPHMPGIRLEDTGKRTDILIHPAHPPRLYLSSVGCLNLTAAIGATDEIEPWGSRTRVIALIDSLHAFAPQAFEPMENTPIPNAWAVIAGEPET